MGYNDRQEGGKGNSGSGNRSGSSRGGPRGGSYGGGSRGGGGNRGPTGPREMHKAVCADCKKDCQVPFKPKEDRPVYCRDCFDKHKPKQF